MLTLSSSTEELSVPFPYSQSTDNYADVFSEAKKQKQTTTTNKTKTKKKKKQKMG